MNGVRFAPRLLALSLGLALAATAVSAQPVATDAEETASATTQAPAAPATDAFAGMRPPDQRGVNVFEAPKAVGRLNGGSPRLRVGGAFAQQFQALSHSNTATEVLNANNVNVNQLADLGAGFNLATANLNLNALLADGVQVELVTYLSSRHHQEAWVKGGYLQVDAAEFLGVEAIDRIMESVTLKLGHFEINYGDAHFRRTDNGNALYNLNRPGFAGDRIT